MGIGTKIRQRRKALGLTLEELSEKSGVEVGTISALENRDSNRSLHFPALAKAMSVSMEELHEDDFLEFREMDVLTRRVKIASPEDNELAQVKRVNFKLSAGVCGYTIDPIEDERPPIYFRKDWCSRNNYAPENLLAVLVNGDSMVPSLFHGDLVVINTADKHPKDGEVFAANYEGELVIKRMRKDGSDWWLDSDAADQLRFRPRRCAEGCFILGRVIYKQSERI